MKNDFVFTLILASISLMFYFIPIAITHKQARQPETTKLFKRVRNFYIVFTGIVSGVLCWLLYTEYIKFY